MKSSFDPIKVEADGKKVKSIIWNTKSIEKAIRGLGQGRKLVANPFYENNVKLLKGDLVFLRTEDEINDWMACRNDILFFAEKHCKLMTPEGIKFIKLREYQKRYLKHLMGAQLSIYLSCRQSGKTTTSAIFLLHYATFNIDKNILVLGNKRKTAVEILDKIKKIYLELPFYLKPGIYKWNESEIVFDNGCRIMAEATTINSGIGFTFHCVLADEFAHVPPNVLDSFYNNLFPTVTAGKAKFIITSTQNGYNLFYRLYKAAEAGDNDYKWFKTDWWEVPEWNPETNSWDVRDESWHHRQVANYGSEEAFNKQFGTNFDLSANTLISQKTIRKKTSEAKEFIIKDLPGVMFAQCFYWDPDYDPITSLRNDYIICTADLSEGIGMDRTVIPIAKMIHPGSDDVEVIGYFMTDMLKRDQVALAIQSLMCLYMNMDTTLLSFEYNTYGELFLQFLLSNSEKIQTLASFDRSAIIKYYNDDMTKWRYGIKITSLNKKTGCILFKESFERGEFIFNDGRFLSELTNFCDSGNGRYEASFGHDDLMMASVQFEFVKQTIQYKAMRNEFNETGTKPPKDEYSWDDFNDQLNNLHNPYVPYKMQTPDPYITEERNEITNQSRLK